MNLTDIINRDPRPVPWEEVSKIPWDDPAFSARMLREHLAQDHDAASRKTSMIDQHVEWIDREILGGRPARILDLGCGPGLYCTRLARRGHRCTGIDFGPASIEHARGIAASASLNCEFELGDLREAAFGEDRDAVMLVFGEFNTFRREECLTILEKARAALSPDGSLLLEAHTLNSIRMRGLADKTWDAVESGLFSDRPYIRLDDAAWNADTRTTVERHYVIDANSGTVKLYGTTTQAYSRQGYEELLKEASFSGITWRDDWPNLNPGVDFEMLIATP